MPDGGQQSSQGEYGKHPYLMACGEVVLVGVAGMAAVIAAHVIAFLEGRSAEAWPQVAATGALVFFSVGVVWPKAWQLLTAPLETPLSQVEKGWGILSPVVITLMGTVVGSACIRAHTLGASGEALVVGERSLPFQFAIWAFAIGYYTIASIRIR